MSRLCRSAPFLLVAHALLAAVPIIPDKSAHEIMVHKAEALHCTKLDGLIREAVRRKLPGEAARLLEAIESLDPEYRRLDLLRTVVEKCKEEKDAKKRQKIRIALRKKRAELLFTLATKIGNIGLTAKDGRLLLRTYDMFWEVIRLYPDHAQARKYLGFKRSRSKTWITVWEYQMGKKYFLTEEGWFPAKRKRDYEKGLRPWQGTWIDEDKERQLRTRSNEDPYVVQGEHFQVASNLGRKKAWQLAVLLEDFYQQFIRVFFGYYDDVSAFELLFGSIRRTRRGRAPAASDRHHVILFPTQNDYLTYVRQECGNEPLLKDSAGFYSRYKRQSHFYWTDDLASAYSTLYHEVAHQLFAETRKDVGRGSTGNYWVVESLAVYVETWKKAGGEWIVGADHRRIAGAKAFLSPSCTLDLAGFIALDHKGFHGEGRAFHYALAGALCHFFMHYQNKRYTADFIRYVSEFYSGKATKNSLWTCLGVADKKGLERQFKEYLKKLGTKQGSDDTPPASR